ncbi:MAG TPA: LysR family transcriptional regulator [Candidatus Eisenbacteria bacterium]|nr:LysR family transcriptional regulator [Candidatus Eisenbacteria bacterium]
MDLRQLRYVVAVARLGGFTRAAEELHVAQPALSLAVRQLERELGVRLFDRTSRRVTPTDAGIAFAARATRILSEVEGVAEEMAEFAGALRGTVRASIWYHLDPALPGLLRDFVVANPAIRLSIVELPTPAAVEELRAGTLDFGVLGMALPFDLGDLETITIREEPVVLAVRSGHLLARERTIPIARLADVPLIMGRRETSLRRTTEYVLSAAGVSPEVILETNEIAAAVAYASIGIGGVILPRTAIEGVGRAVAIVAIENAPLFRVALAWSPTGYRRPAAALALVYAQAVAERELAQGGAA